MTTKLCCLCVAPSSEYRTLQNEEGEHNEIYEILIKYFDPMLITLEDNCLDCKQESKVLCQNCWKIIKEFHEFQQNVIKTRKLLVKVEKEQFPILLENENKFDDVNIDYKDERVFESEDDNVDSGYKIKSNVDNLVDDSGNSNDDNFLKTSKNFTEIKNILRGSSSSKKIKGDCEIQKPNIRRGRKRKNIILEKNTGHSKRNDTKIKKQKIIEKNKSEKGNSKLIVKNGGESDALISEWKPILECDLCEETACSFDKLRLHFKKNHKSRCYTKCCERKFYRRYSLANHIQLHLKPDTHKCDICGKISSNKANLQLHKKLMHEDIDQLECNVCHKFFKLKANLDRHLLTHVKGDKDFICQDCGKAYVLEIQLKSHMKSVHHADRICDQCGKTFHGIQTYKNHLLNHAGIAKPKFPCDECGVELITRSSLKRHKAAYHHDGSTIYVCGICGKVTSSENALRNHKKYVHEEERKHKCTYCDKAFKRPKGLVEHIATHTGQELYQCPHCPQTFKVSSNMHHHRKKVHPIEWENARKNRLQVPKIDIKNATNQVII